MGMNFPVSGLLTLTALVYVMAGIFHVYQV
jgi:hypothetical protein